MYVYFKTCTIILSSKIQYYVRVKMERKLFRSGNGWALFMPQTILQLLKVNPLTDKVECIMENDVLKIKKAKNPDIQEH